MKYFRFLIFFLSLLLITQSCSSLGLKSKSYSNQFSSISDLLNQSSFSSPSGLINTYPIFIIVSFFLVLFIIRKLYLSKRSSRKLVELDSNDMSLLRLSFDTLNDLLKRINNIGIFT